MMKARRRTAQRIIVFLSIFTALLAGYLHFGLLPGALRPYAIQKLESFTHKKIYFSKVLFVPFKGLSFFDFNVADESSEPIFSSKIFSIDAKLMPFLKEKKIVIDNVLLEYPVYDFILEPPKKKNLAPPPKTSISGQINVPVLPESEDKKISIDSPEDVPNAFLPENVYLEQIEIREGFMTIRKNKKGPVSEILRSVNLRAHFNRPPLLSIEGSLALGERAYASLNLKGVWDLEKTLYQFDLLAKSDLVPDWLLNYQKNNFIILKNGRFMFDAHLKNIDAERILFRSKTQLKDSTLSVKQTDYTGEMSMTAKGLFNINTKHFERYAGDLGLVDVSIHHVSKAIENIDHVSGQIAFEPDLLAVKSIKGEYKSLPFNAEGSVKSFKELLVSANIYSDSDISKLFGLLTEEQRESLQNFDIQGRCESVTTIDGSLKTPENLKIINKLLITGGTFKTKNNKINVTDVTADVFIDKNGIEITNGKFIHAKIPYSLSMFIPKNPESSGTLELSAKELKVSTAYSLSKEEIYLKKASAYYQGISAEFEGRFKNLENPQLQIHGKTEINLEHVSQNFSLAPPALKAAGLKGILRGNFILNGVWNDPLNWDLGLDARGTPIFVKDKFRFENLIVQARLKNKIFHIPYFHTTPYQGNAGGTLTLNLSRPDNPFDIKMYGRGINLEKLIRDLGVKDQKISGKAMFQISVNGLLKDQATYYGLGALDVDGNIWQTDLFKQMGNLPFVRVQGMDLVTFHKLDTSFAIHEKRLWTSNLVLQGDTVVLSLDGSMGFDQALDFLMDIRFSNSIIQGAFDTGGLVPFVVQEAQDFISKYHIGGTLKSPKCEKIPLPMGHVIGKKISGLLQNFTQ